MTLPLVLLAIPSVYAGWAYINPLLFGNYFGNAIAVNEVHDVIGHLREEYQHVSSGQIVMKNIASLPLLLALSGIATAWFLYIARPDLPEKIAGRFRAVYVLLDNKYYFDEFNDWFFAGGARKIGNFFWRQGDVKVIDGFFVNGAARMVAGISRLIRELQSGYVYHYAFAMIFGLFVLLSLSGVLDSWFVKP